MKEIQYDNTITELQLSHYREHLNNKNLLCGAKGDPSVKQRYNPLSLCTHTNTFPHMLVCAFSLYPTDVKDLLN